MGTNILLTLVDKFQSITAAVVPLLLGVISIVFLWNVIKFITSAGDEGKRAEAQKMIMYSVVGMFVAMAVWGLVNALKDFFLGGTSTAIPQRPTFPGE